MSIPINIQNKVIQFPSVAQSPQWGQAVIDFAKATEGALAGVTGNFDVPPQVIDISASNPASNVVIASLNFPPSDVRSAFMQYAVFRTANAPSATAYETGTFIIIYDTTSGQWVSQRDFIGDGKISFAISNTGQVSYSTEQIGSTGHAGKLTFSAKAILQTE